jgi:hypothetical protein
LPEITSATAVLGSQRADAAAVERHDEARRAEAALRSVPRHHLALDGMEFAVARQALDRHQRLAVEHRREQDAGC